MRQFKVRFTPQNKEVAVPQGTDLISACAKAGIMLNAACGGEGLCGKCRLVIESGEAKSDRSSLITEADRKRGVVLACQTLVEGDVVVAVPGGPVETRERASHEAEDFTKGIILKRESVFEHSPLVRKICIDITKPTAEDNTSDLERIESGLRAKAGPVRLSTRLANMKHLSEVMRESDYRLTVTLARKDGVLEMLYFEPGDCSSQNLAMAFDIGTTTVVGQLVDLNTRSILGTRIAFNNQASYGSDVITRIIYASRSPDALDTLSAAVLDNMNEMIEDLASANGVSPAAVNAVVCAGNMTMMHLMLRIDPSNIRKAPYVPTVSAFPMIGAAEIGLEINPRGVAAFLPGVSTYIGGDTVAGVLACGLAEGEDISLLVDIGTNGEIVLGNREWMIGSAASAGPAFEGSGLKCGMKAVRGAIQRVTIDKGLKIGLGTIDGSPPKGICGSGYIDLLCQMLKSGLMGKDGKLRREKCPDRIRRSDNNYEFVVAFKDESGAEADIVIQEDDIENLKRSKGAIYSAIVALLAKVEKDISEVRKVYIAGGFGNYLNIENSVFIGLLPDMPRDAYEFVGNSSLAGARMSLLSQEAFERSEAIHKGITYLDLSAEPKYMDEYVASLFFPHTDIGRFPSVRL